MLDGLDHPADRVDLLEVLVRVRLQLVGQRLDEVGAAERVDRVGDAGLVRDHLLRAQRDPHGVLARQRERLVVGVRVQRLGAAEHAGERLDRRPHDVVQRLLGGQRHARGLRVEAHQPRLRVARPIGVAQLARPDPPRRAILGDLLEKVDVGVEEEAQTRREVVDVHPARDLLLDIRQAVLERERQLLRSRRTGLADVVAADRDRMPARHLTRRPLHHVAQQPHRRINRETPLLLRDVLLQDVRLDRAAQALARHPGLLRRDDVERHHDRRGRVDRHRHRDRAEVDAPEQRLHVVERVDRHTLATDLTRANARDRSRAPSATACRTPCSDPVCPCSSR